MHISTFKFHYIQLELTLLLFTIMAEQADGWIIEKINLLANPNIQRPKRFWGVYTKLKIFNMTNYKKSKR